MTKYRLLASLVAAALLAGCATDRGTLRTIEQREDEAASLARAAFPRPMSQSKDANKPGVSSAPIVVRNEAYRREAPAPVEPTPQVQLPQLKSPVALTRQFSGLLEIADWMRSEYGVPVRGSSDIVEANIPAERLRFLNFQGTLEHFLDALSMRTGISWSVARNSLQLAVTDTRTYVIDAAPGDTSLQTALGVSGSMNNGGATSAGAAQGTVQSNTSVNATISVWQGIDKSIQSMLSRSGKFTLSQATGLLVVTDRAEVHEKVKAYVEETNARLNTQVVVNVRSFVVKRNNADNYGINWDLVYRSLTNRYGFNVSNTFDVLATGTSAVFTILPNSNVANGRFNSSEAVVQALSSEAQVSNVSDSTIATINGAPAPLHIGTQTTYLAAVTQSQTPNVGSQSSLTPGVVNSGLVLNVTPVVLNNKDIKLQFSMDLSSLLGITRQTSGGNSIQTPALDRRSSLQTVIVRNGEAVVIAGSQQSVDQNDRKGTGTATNFLFGGGVNASSTKETLVVVITARVIDRKGTSQNVAAR